MTRAERTRAIVSKCREYEKTVLNNAEAGIDAAILAMSKPTICNHDIHTQTRRHALHGGQNHDRANVLDRNRKDYPLRNMGINPGGSGNVGYSDHEDGLRERPCKSR